MTTFRGYINFWANFEFHIFSFSFEFLLIYIFDVWMRNLASLGDVSTLKELLEGVQAMEYVISGCILIF
ncbi:hypothetical protein Syun_028299 [Stephania yunnanensis]|uniref:Uncharacterized protein n=1 Tax=Stephania yunnanensis TaxID=152371 RepID=A0AAP0HLS8_9MAGN